MLTSNSKHTRIELKNEAREREEKKNEINNNSINHNAVIEWRMHFR